MSTLNPLTVKRMKQCNVTDSHLGQQLFVSGP